MGQEERRKRDQQALRNRILDAARELFADLGYEAVTMRRIAEADRVFPHHDLPPLQRQGGPGARAVLGGFPLTGRSVSGRSERSPIPSRASRRSVAPIVDFALDHPNHYRLMFMTPHPPVPENGTADREGEPRRGCLGDARRGSRRGTARRCVPVRCRGCERTGAAVLRRESTGSWRSTSPRPTIPGSAGHPCGKPPNG